VLAVYAASAQLLAFAALALLEDVVDRNRRLIAKISATTLLIAFLAVAVFPAKMTTGEWRSAGFWVVLACFIAGEVSANFFITAMEGLISVEKGGRRAQLVGQANKFVAVGVAGVLIAGLSGILEAHFDRAQSAIMLGAIIVGAFSLMFVAGFYALHRRDGRLA
jgi:hypothetical protein